MKKVFLFLVIIILPITSVYSKVLTDTTFEKTGWLIYYRGHIIWVESRLGKNPMDESFFLQTDYRNGLMVDYINDAHLFKSIAKEYAINVLFYDSNMKKADYLLKDSISILPVKAMLRTNSNPISKLVELQGLSFKRNTETTIMYKFQTDYVILDVQLLRKKDKRRIKKAKIL